MIPVRIADLAVWSPYGPDPAALAAALAGDRPPAARHVADALPEEGTVPVPGFDIAAEVGAKGIRSMDRATALAVSATGRLLDAAGPDRSRTALILGTTCGSLETMMAFGAESLTRPKPYQVDPGKLPVAVMNYAAGQCAIRHGITGPNTTIPMGRNATAHALRYAARLLATGRIDQAVCGASEEAGPARAWFERHARPAAAPAVPVGEGCVMLRLVPDDAEPGPRISAIAAELSSGDPAEALESALRRALADAGVDPAEVRAVADTAALDGHGTAETQALQAVFGSAPKRLTVHPLIGDTSAASIGFGLAAILADAVHQTEPDPTCGAFAVTAIDRTGLACCVIGRT